MPPIWFKKKKPEVLVEIADLQNCGLEEVPKDLLKHGQTLHTVKLNSNNLTSLPAEFYNMWKIKNLEIWDNDLEKLSPDIGNLCSLVHLNISRNLLVGLPLEIENCQELVYADFSSNPLSEFPEDLTRMYHLRQLYLNDTNLERLPRQFGRMSKLEVLEVRENFLSDLPETCSHMTLLLQLNIGCNQFERLPPVVTNLINLEELWVDMNALSTLPRSISNLAHLRVLDLSENRLLELPDTIGDCTQLTDLYLSRNSLTFLPESIGNLVNLRTLSCDQNKLMILPQGIGGLSSLTEMNISGNNLKMLPPSIGYLKNLTAFIAADNWLDYLPPEMGSCCSLQILSVQGNQLASLPPEFCHLSQLTILNIVGNRIQNLPFSLTALKNIRALWISSTQSKPLIELQTEADTKLNRVLTCVYFPQKESEMYRKPSASNLSGGHPTITFERKSSINFELSEEQNSKGGQKSKESFSYPKEHHINAMKRMSRDLCSAMSDCSLTLSLSQTLSQNFSQQDFSCPSPSPANFKMATQVMKLQNKEKRQLMLVKRNSMVKNIDSESSSVSSDGSFEELKKLRDVEEESERAPSTNPSTCTPITQISLRHSPLPSLTTVSERSVETSTSSKMGKKIEVPRDAELELMISTLEAEVKGLEGRLQSVHSSSPSHSTGGGSQQTGELKNTASLNGVDDDTQTVSEFISYDSSPKTYKRKTGSVPNIHNADPNGPLYNSDGQSDLSTSEQEKPFKLKVSASRSLGSDLILNRLQDMNDDGLSASASASRIDLWVKEQSKLHQEGLASKESLDDSSLLAPNSKHGTQETLIINASTSDEGEQSASVCTSSPSNSLKKTGVHKQWYNSPQTQHHVKGSHNHSPFSSISQSSTDNSLSTSGGERNGRSSPPTTLQKDSKRRPNSNLSRDSGYTSKEYVMMDPYVHHMASSTRTADRSVKVGMPTRTEFRRSPTEPISTEALNRKAELFNSDYPYLSNMGHTRRVSAGAAPMGKYAHSRSPGEMRAQKPRLPSTGAISHTLNYDYTYTDRYYRNVPQPQVSPMSSPAARKAYYKQQVQRTAPPKPQTTSTGPQQSQMSGSGFVAQLNKMSAKHSAKSAPLFDDGGQQQEAFQGRFHGGVSMLGLNSEVGTNSESWMRSSPLVQPKGASESYGKKYSTSRHVRRSSAPFVDRAIIEAVIAKSTPTGPLGITITGGVNSQNLCHPGDPSLYILKLAETGPAYQSGKLQRGDRILKVNGVDVKGFSQEQAASLLKQALRISVILVSREIAETLL